MAGTRKTVGATAGTTAAAPTSCTQGQPLIDGTLEAVKHVLAGLSLADQNAKRYTFLLYNGSVHHWHAVQPLQVRVCVRVCV